MHHHRRTFSLFGGIGGLSSCLLTQSFTMPSVGALAAAVPREAQKPAPCRGRSLQYCLAEFVVLFGMATGPARRIERHLGALTDGRDGRSPPVVVREWDDPGEVVGIAGDTAGDRAQVAFQAHALIDEGIVAPSASSDDNYTAGCADTAAGDSTPSTNHEEGGGGGGGGDTSTSHGEEDDDGDSDEEMGVAADDGDDEDDDDDSDDGDAMARTAAVRSTAPPRVRRRGPGASTALPTSVRRPCDRSRPRALPSAPRRITATRARPTRTAFAPPC